jgi:hypothetical protein
MNKQAFNARARTGRHLARIAAQVQNAWVVNEAREYARTGHIGPDLGAYLNWYWRGDEFPQTPYGALVAWEKAHA